jgi:hypothetical protein
MTPMLGSLCVLFFLLLLLPAASVAQVGNTPRPASTARITGILSAMTLEIETLGQELTDKTEMTVQGIRFTTGSLKDRKVVLFKHGWEDPGWGRDDASQISILSAVHALADQISDTELRAQVKKLSSKGIAKIANRMAGTR